MDGSFRVNPRARRLSAPSWITVYRGWVSRQIGAVSYSSITKTGDHSRARYGSRFRRSFPTCSEKERAPLIKSKGRNNASRVLNSRPALRFQRVTAVLTPKHVGNLPNGQRETLTGGPWLAARPNLPSVLQAHETAPNNPCHFQLRHGRSSVCMRRVRCEAQATGREKSMPLSRIGWRNAL